MRQSALAKIFAAPFRATARGVVLGLYLSMLTIAVAVVSAMPAMAQSASSQTAVRDFDIPATALGAALLRFGEQSGLQFSVDSALTNGKRTRGIKGKYTPEGGLRAILIGSGLTFRFTGPRTVVVEKQPDTGDARVLGPLRVEGADRGTAVNGINGSTDVTATEGTGSYSSGVASIASKMPLSVKDTPQTVSVITRQRIEDQNLTDLTSVMNQTAGVTLVQLGNSLNTKYYSRGFEITRFQIDGGAPVSSGQLVSGATYSPVFDTAMYDHVELLRGADGLFNGYGSPGGAINLVRKRPLDHQQVVVEGQIGSWSNYRTVVDATSPLGFDGKVRGRAVLSYQDQDYFYDIANSNRTMVYGVLEADVTPSTTFSLGVDSNRLNALPWVDGLPRYENGDDLGLSRSTCLCFDWNRTDFKTTNVFAQVEQELGDKWIAKINLMRTRQERSGKHGFVSGPVNSTTRSGALLNAVETGFSGEQLLAELTASGEFDLLGHKQTLVIGGNWRKNDNSGWDAFLPLYGFPNNPAVDVLNFNARNYPEPVSSSIRYGHFPEDIQHQQSLYAAARLTFWKPLHVTVGLRYSLYKYSFRQDYFCTNASSGCGEVGDLTSTLSAKSEDHDFSWPPMLGLEYDLSDSWSMYASYTDIYESNTGLLDIERKQIDPTTGSNVEVGVKFESEGGKINGSIAAYRIEQKNFPLFIDFVPSENPNTVCCFSNGSNKVNYSQGVDAELSGEISPGWQLFAGYTYNRNETKGSDAEFGVGLPLQSLMPKHLLKLWTSYQFQRGGLWQRVNIGGGVNFQTESYQQGSACVSYVDGPNGIPICAADGFVPYDYIQGSYALLSARVSYELDSHWNIALNVNNLTNRTYYQTMGTSSSGNWYGEPRNFTLTLRGSF